MPLGCSVHNTPLYTALKQALPGCTIIVATRGLSQATLQHDPHIDHLLTTADPTTSLFAALRVARQLRRTLRQQDLHPTLILQDASSRAGSFALFAALLRLAPTAGFANAPALYDTHLPYDPTLSIIDNNLRLLTVLGATPRHVEPAVYFTPADLAHARTLLADDAVDAQAATADALGRGQGASYLPGGSRGLQAPETASSLGRALAPGTSECSPTTAFILQGSGAQPTAWHDDRFAAVIRHAASRGHRILYLGTAAEAPTIDRIRALAGNLGTSLAGRTTVPQLAAVLCLCDLAISVDTGSLHVARATGLPLVILHPCWQDPLDWLPIYAPNARILRGPHTPTIPPNYRLDDIPTDAATTALDDLITLYPTTPAAREARTQRLLSTTRAGGSSGL
jgi:ADP-heptose:LPS heptosyltransferase